MSTKSSPYPRDNFWGDDQDHEQPRRGHTECAGTDPASYLAFRELAALTTPICERSLDERGEEIELSDPEMYLPKQIERSCYRIEYRQHRHRRRYNPETGWINWGETTSTVVPEVGKQIYMQAVENYLCDRGVRHSNIDAWRQYAERLFHDQQLTSTGALTRLIAKKRAYDDPQNRQVAEVPG